MSADLLETIKNYATQCLLPKLSKRCEESEYHPEYQLWQNNLEQHFQNILNTLEKADLDQEHAPETLSFIVILYYELQSGVSTSEAENSNSEKCSQNLNLTFKNKYGIELDEVLKTEHFETQEIFDICMKYLHEKLNLNEFKNYPGLVVVYYNLMKNVEDLEVEMNPTSVLPISLILIDDYIISNKLRGLQSCLSILNCLSSSEFIDGNYYEVIYRSLKKNIVEKDLEVSKVLLKCLLEMIRIFPQHLKKSVLDDMFSIVLDQLHTESNLYRKAEFFIFITKIIEYHGIHSIKKRILKIVIGDNLDVCTENAVSEILLEPLIKCLKMWIKHCWCIWRLSLDKNLLLALFKILYLSKEDTTMSEIQQLITTMILLCRKEEQLQIKQDLENMIPTCPNVLFLKSIQTIKQSIEVYLVFSKLNH